MAAAHNLQLVQNPLEDQDVELFRAGDYGDKGSFSQADIDQMIANYDPAHHEAPLTIGHNDEDALSDKAPSFGWVQSLKRVGDLLVGRFSKVVPEFTDMVRQGLYKKRSVGLYKTSNGWSLRHVAFLGAAPPHVKGLADIKFEDNGAVTQVTFQEETQMDPKDLKQVEDNLFTRIKAFFTESFSGKPADAASQQPTTAAIAAAVEEQMKPIREAEAKRQTEFAEAQKKTAIATRSARADAAIAQVKSKGAWVPAFDKLGVPALFHELAASDAVVEFTEGEGDKKTTVKKSPLELMTAFMEAHGKIVPAGKLVDVTAAAAAQKSKTVAFKEGNAKADPNSVLLAEEIKKVQAEKKVSFTEALAAVRGTNPELFIPGGATAGTV